MDLLQTLIYYYDIILENIKKTLQNCLNKKIKIEY